MGVMGPIRSKWTSSKGFEAVDNLLEKEDLVILTTAHNLHGLGALIGIPILLRILR
jgi:hypothetical protein